MEMPRRLRCEFDQLRVWRTATARRGQLRECHKRVECHTSEWHTVTRGADKRQPLMRSWWRIIIDVDCCGGTAPDNAGRRRWYIKGSGVLRLLCTRLDDLSSALSACICHINYISCHMKCRVRVVVWPAGLLYIYLCRLDINIICTSSAVTWNNSSYHSALKYNTNLGLQESKTSFDYKVCSK